MINSSLKNRLRRYKTYIISDKTYIKNKFKKKFGYELDLENPKTLNEKIQWLKLYGMTELHTKCTDKYAVREYVKEKIGEKYLIPLLYHTENYKDIIPENLPDEPCVIKPNHDSGNPIFVKDKSLLDYSDVQKELKKRLSRNYYTRTREKQYKDIKPRIVVEKLISNYEHKIPNEYKFTCVHGKIEIIEVHLDKNTSDFQLIYLDSRWKLIDNNNDTVIEKPKQIDELLNVVTKLAQDFLFVRVDIYIAKDKIYFGELTFSPSSGLNPILAFNDQKLGKILHLSK